jgi:hypothetical protein
LIGTIGPLVKAAKHTKQWLPLLALYTLGSSLAAMLVGAIVGLLGSAVMKSQWRSPALLGVAIIGIVFALSDFEIVGMHTLTFRRQTCPVWWRDFGPLLATALWGFDLGLGFSTIRVASLYWIVLLVIFILASPVRGAAILAGYGLALSLNLGIGIIGPGRFKDTHSAHMQALLLLRPLKVMLGSVLLFWCSMIISLTIFFWR